MDPKQTVKPPAVALPPVDLGLNADRNLGQFVADTKLHITQEAFSQTYEQGLSSWFDECAPSDVDVLLGDRVAALLLEGARRGLLRAVVRSAIYTTVLVSVCFLVRLPTKAFFVIVPAAFVSGVCLSKRS